MEQTIVEHSVETVAVGKQTEESSSVVQDAKFVLDRVSEAREKTRHDRRINLPNITTHDINKLLDGVDSLVESLPPLVKVLDGLVQIHPFIGDVVGVFKVVIELEVKRRDNDKKVNLLFLEMKNMMFALLQLQGVRPNHVARDGMTIKDRLEKLVKRTANDIKECANVCDTYSKKRLLVKVLKAHTWDDTLKGYFQLFTERKAEFNLAASIHTGITVDQMNDKLDSLIQRMEIIAEFFACCIPQSQRTLDAMVKQAGGADVTLERMETIRDLLDKERSFESPALGPYFDIPHARGHAQSMTSWLDRGYQKEKSGFNYSRETETQRTRRRSFQHGQPMPSQSVNQPSSLGASTYYPASTPIYNTQSHGSVPVQSQPTNHTPFPGSTYYPASAPMYTHQPYVPLLPGGIDYDQEISLLKQELANTPASEIRHNFWAFERKFEIQTKALAEEMKRIVVHEGDRVIMSVLAGPHEKIVDPDLYEIWKDMRWRGIVKARHFVLAVHDYFLQRLDDGQRGTTVNDSLNRRISEDDAWTLEYIDLMHLQSIIEVLDEDSSGYITIQEINQFTTTRPKGWSLLHWFGYWAIGWQVCMTAYKNKIIALFSRMQAIAPQVRFSLQGRVMRYLANIQQVVGEMVMGFQGVPERLFLLPRFQAYMEQEEARLREGLETVNYDLDALDTVALISGRKGLERNLFPLLYLLMSRHYDIMKLCQKHIVYVEEFTDAEGSVLIIKDAFELRRNELSGLFQQRRLLVSQEISEFACGMFLPGLPMLAVLDSDVPEASESGSELPTLDILKYPIGPEDFFPVSEDGLRDTWDGKEVSDTLKPILGHWAGRIQGSFMLNLDFHASPTSKDEVVAYPLLYYPWAFGGVHFIGKQDKASTDEPVYVFTATFTPSRAGVEYFRMTLSHDGTTLAGDMTPDFSSTWKQYVVWKRDVSPQVLRCYPSSTSLEANKARALWEFATSAVLSEIRGRTLSWKHIKAYRDRLRRFSLLLFGEAALGQLGEEDSRELNQLKSRSTPAEVHFAAYAGLESPKFPWMLRPCCRKVLKAVPSIRCYSCQLGYWNTEPSHSFCLDNPECPSLSEHLKGEREMHLIFKIRALDWSIMPFKDSGAWLRGRAAMTRACLVPQDYLVSRSPPSRRLSSITEVTEPDVEVTPVDEHAPEVDVALATQESFSPATVSASHFEAYSSSNAETGERSSPEPLATVFFPSTPTSETAFEPDAANDVSTKSPSDADTFSATLQRKCAGCNQEVTLPCWLCTECPEGVLICLACDEDEGGINRDGHKSRHTLLRVYDPESQNPTYRHPGGPGLRFDLSRNSTIDPESDEDNEYEEYDRGSEAELPLAASDTGFTRIEARLDSVEDRLGRIEGMLESLMSLLRSTQTSQMSESNLTI